MHSQTDGTLPRDQDQIDSFECPRLRPNGLLEHPPHQIAIDGAAEHFPGMDRKPNRLAACRKVEDGDFVDNPLLSLLKDRAHRPFIDKATEDGPRFFWRRGRSRGVSFGNWGHLVRLLTEGQNSKVGDSGVALKR